MSSLDVMLATVKMLEPPRRERSVVTKCKRVEPNHRGKIKKCKYHGSCNGYLRQCKWKLK